MCGSEGKGCDPHELTAGIERQKLLLILNSTSLDVEEAASRLGLPADIVRKYVSELVSCGLLREERGKYRPSFAIFIVKDQEILYSLVEELSCYVMRIVRAWLPRFQTLLNTLTVARRKLGFRDLEYIAIGALALDYEALRVLSEVRNYHRIKTHARRR